MPARKTTHLSSLSLPLLCAASALVVATAGCGNGAVFPATTSPGAAVVVSGKVHGGQQPVSGATIQVYENATSAYGAASTALITPGTGAIGSTGYTPGGGTCTVSNANTLTCLPLPTTNASGDFNITGAYSCTAGSQVYLLATRGNPGLSAGTSNAGIALMAGLGACPATQTLALTTPVVLIDEVSTVATAYAFAGFFTDATHLATNGSAKATTGIDNAALNIAAISSITTGNALAITPNGQGTVPQAELNLLANILAACVNSDGSGCTSLFSLAKNGSVTPTETATAAINIAHNPGANVTALYNTASSVGPFQPTLGSAPNDFTVNIDYVPSTPLLATQGTIAIDADGDVWGPGANAASVVELSSLGAETKSIAFTPTSNGQYAPLRVSVSPAGTIWVGNYGLFFAQPAATTFTAVTDTGAVWTGNELAAAFDTSNDAWTGNNYPASIGEISPSGTVVPASDNGYEPGGFAPPNSTTYPAQVFGVAVDSANHVWGICGKCVGNQASGNAAEITHAGVAVSGASGDAPASILYPSSLAIDSGNNAWISDFSTGVVTKYSDTSELLSGSGYPSGSGLGGLNSLAIDGTGNVFLGAGGGPGQNLNGLLYELSNAGRLTSPSTGYQSLSSTFYYPNSIAVDGSGNVWALDFNGGLHVSLGLATPVATPIAPAALGQRP